MKLTSPGGIRYDLYTDMMQQTHLLIAGTTGSGKSVVINGIVCSGLYSFPGNNAGEIQYILIDPKRVELIDYKRLPHTIKYASEPFDIMSALNTAVDIMEKRFSEMQKKGLKEYPGGHIYVIVDEFADLVTTMKRETEPQLIRLAQLGRAAHIHLILATQRPTSDVINKRISVNLDTQLALRCKTARDSRNIMGTTGAELLPPYGRGFYSKPMMTECIEIPMIPDSERMRLVNHWLAQLTTSDRILQFLNRHPA